MFEDYKKKNSRKKTIKVKYLTKEDFYVMSKEELKTIKQMYDPSDPMRKDFKMDLFLSEKGQLFRILEDIKSQLELTNVLSEETMGKPYMAIQKTETDKAKFIILEEKDTKEVEKELISLLWQGIQQADQDLKKSFIEHIQQQSDQQGFESVNQYFQKLAGDENTNVTQEFLNDQYLKYVKDHKQER